MLVLTLNKKDRVNIGSNQLELLSVYDNCIWIAFNSMPIQINLKTTRTIGDDTVKFITNRRGRAMIGLTSPFRIERISRPSLN